MSLNYEVIMVNSVMANASKQSITRFIVNLRFLMAGGTVLSLIAKCKAFLDLMLLLKVSN